MKKIYYSLMLIGALTFSSCSMDKAPYGQLDEETAVQTAKDLRQFRNTLYTGMRSVTSGSWLYFSDIQMDEFHGLISNGNRIGSFSNGVITPSDGDITSMWSGCYAVIATANAIIERADVMKDNNAFSASDKACFLRYKAEAQFVRAYLYFWLADHFCQSYTQCDDPTKPATGLPLVTTYNPTGNISDYPHRSTLAQTFDLIEVDLEDAYDGLSAWEQAGVKDEKDDKNASLAYIHPMTVQALAARIALVKGDWTSALDYATEVINSGKYSLTKINDYAKLWTKDEGTEIIFRPLMTSTELGNCTATPYVSESETRADYVPTSDALYVLWEEEGDVRADVFLKQYSNLQVEGKNYEAFVLNKFPGNSDLRTGSNNNLMNMSKPFRLSEMYLIAAEAEARLGHMENANRYLDILRSNRIVDYAPEYEAKQENLLKLVADERQREFIGEGMRMSDIRRYGQGFTRLATHEESPGLESVIVKQGSNLSYSAKDYRLTWPIPKSEIDANPNLAGEQNPGY